MVKLYCDKCEKEITDKYYTINFWEYETNAKNNPYISVANATSAYCRESALEMLNSQKMYCEDCKHKIENFING